MLEALAVRPFSPGRLGLQTASQVGVVLEGAVEAGLSEVVHLVLGRHEEEHVAPAGVGGVGRPQGQVNQQFRRPHLGRLLGELTDRERTILELVSQGLTNKEIATRLFLSEKTIKHYMTNILQKLQVRNRVEAALLATKDKAAL